MASSDRQRDEEVDPHPRLGIFHAPVVGFRVSAQTQVFESRLHRLDTVAGAVDLRAALRGDLPGTHCGRAGHHVERFALFVSVMRMIAA